MLIEDFFTTRVLANLFGMKGFERDLFFAMSYTQQYRKRKSSVKKPVEKKKTYTVEKCTGQSIYRRNETVEPVGAFNSICEIQEMIQGSQKKEITARDRIRSASTAEFKETLRAIAKERLAEKNRK